MEGESEMNPGEVNGRYDGRSEREHEIALQVGC